MSDFPALDVPFFARLSDYAGLWSMEPSAFAFLWHHAASLNLSAHVREPAQPLRSAMNKLPAPGGKSIAEIQLVGTLMKGQSSLGGTSTIQARRDIRQAAADPEVAGIVLRIDSPGGAVAGTYDLAGDVKAAGRIKPVYAHIEDTGASAAYWVASQADRITANSPTTLVGSIGTLQVIYDESGALEAQGVRPIVFRTGPLKGLGLDKVTDEQVAHVQSLVDSVQEQFDAAVMKGRGMTPTQLKAVNHGGAFTAANALDNKLIDAVQPLSRTVAQMTEMIRTGKGPTALLSDELFAFTHNSETSTSEPDWGSVDKGALPQLAFADHGEPGKKSTWKYPHHWVQNAGGKDENGIWTTGTLLLHRGGLNAAWSAAQGGRSGQKAPQAVIDHLQMHRKALGLDKTNSLALLPLVRRGLPTLAATRR